MRAAAKGALDALRVYLKEKERWDRWLAGPSGLELVITSLGSADREVALGAVEAVAALKAKEALPRLVELLTTRRYPWRPDAEDPDFRRAVTRAIERIGQE